jgi:hypothetical protein
MDAPIAESHQALTTMTTFNLTTEDEVQKLVMSAPTKSCNIDPIPTWLLKECLPALLPVLTKLVNASLTTAEMPTNLKAAIVTPLLKKSTLDPDVLKNYRPVSNLTFVSKLIERVVAKRLVDYFRRTT